MFFFSEEERAGMKGFEKRPYLIVGDDYIPMTFAEGVKKFGAYCKPERFGPPELCYRTEAPTELPAVSCFAYGEGLGLCFPWHIGTDYYRDGHEGWLMLVGAVLETYCGVKKAGDDLSPMVEVTHGAKDGLELVHFVNGSGHFGNSYFDPAMLTDQSVTIDWPHETAVCENLDEAGNVSWKLEDQRLTITIPKLGAHACVVIKEEA